MAKQQHTYIDLFAGCGGLSLGLTNAGWKGIVAIEKNQDAFKTFSHNLLRKDKWFDWPEWFPQKAHDVNEVINIYKESFLNLKGTIDLVAGGPPCQGFSFAGRRKENDFRNSLVDSYISFIGLVKPKIIFFENVKGFTLKFNNNANNGRVYSNYVINALETLGYNVSGELIDFSNYGIPQKRTRFILVGILKKNDENSFLSQKFFSKIAKNRHAFLISRNLKIPVTLEEAISDLLEENGTVESPDNHIFKSAIYCSAKSKYQQLMRQRRRAGTVPDSHRLVNHSKKIKKRFQYAINNNLTSKKYQTFFNLRKSGTKKLEKTLPTSTLTTLPDDYIHYCEPRILTVREYARIQSFPDTYEFKGRYTTGGKARTKSVPRYSQIGNAIPPLFAEQCGLILKDLVDG